jgi:hypothetical protein
MKSREHFAWIEDTAFEISSTRIRWRKYVNNPDSMSLPLKQLIESDVKFWSTIEYM